MACPTKAVELYHNRGELDLSLEQWLNDATAEHGIEDWKLCIINPCRSEGSARNSLSELLDAVLQAGDFITLNEAEYLELCMLMYGHPDNEPEPSMFPNGFESWRETHHEVVRIIELHLANARAEHGLCHTLYRQQGTEGMWMLSREITDEFEAFTAGSETQDLPFVARLEEFVRNWSLDQINWKRYGLTMPKGGI